MYGASTRAHPDAHAVLLKRVFMTRNCTARRLAEQVMKLCSSREETPNLSAEQGAVNGLVLSPLDRVGLTPKEAYLSRLFMSLILSDFTCKTLHKYYKICIA